MNWNQSLTYLSGHRCPGGRTWWWPHQTRWSPEPAPGPRPWGSWRWSEGHRSWCVWTPCRTSPWRHHFCSRSRWWLWRSIELRGCTWDRKLDVGIVGSVRPNRDLCTKNGQCPPQVGYSISALTSKSPPPVSCICYCICICCLTLLIKPNGCYTICSLFESLGQMKEEKTWQESLSLPLSQLNFSSHL